MAAKSLTWALIIATYKREHILSRCLRLAASQTIPPKEIVVVDASPDYEKTRDLITNEFTISYPQIQLIYVKAERPSLPTQRNQGIKLSSADVVFIIDDDSLMYPDCAAEVMKIYEADVYRVVKGISAIAVSEPPDIQNFNKQVKAKKTTWIKRFMKFILQVESKDLLPYDGDYPVHNIPQELCQFNFVPIKHMLGFAMTFRSEILQKERFDEILLGSAPCEDDDISYRVSRHGLIINALNAKLCHLEIFGGRLSAYTVSVLAALNPAVLYQFHSNNIERSNQDWRQVLRRKTLFSLLKDISQRQWSFPKTRGVIYALSQLNLIYAKSQQELLEWYPQFQEMLINQNKA